MHKILVLGSGGREDALCWKIARSPELEKLYCAPGNGGTLRHAENIALNAADHDAVIAFCRKCRDIGGYRAGSAIGGRAGR